MSKIIAKAMQVKEQDNAQELEAWMQNDKVQLTEAM